MIKNGLADKVLSSKYYYILADEFKDDPITLNSLIDIFYEYDAHISPKLQKGEKRLASLESIIKGLIDFKSEFLSRYQIPDIGILDLEDYTKSLERVLERIQEAKLEEERAVIELDNAERQRRAERRKKARKRAAEAKAAEARAAEEKYKEQKKPETKTKEQIWQEEADEYIRTELNGTDLESIIDFLFWIKKIEGKPFVKIAIEKVLHDYPIKREDLELYISTTPDSNDDKEKLCAQLKHLDGIFTRYTPGQFEDIKHLINDYKESIVRN